MISVDGAALMARPIVLCVYVRICILWDFLLGVSCCLDVSQITPSVLFATGRSR